MDFLKKINDAGLVAQKPVRKLKDLETNKRYMVHNLKAFNCTKLNGQRVIQVELEDCIVYLPKRMVDVTTDDACVKLLAAKAEIIYRGQVDCGKVLPASKVEFVID